MNEAASQKTFPWRFALALALLAATFLVTKYGHFNKPQGLVRPLDSIPTQLAGWQFVADEPVEPEVLSTLAATTILSRAYQRNGDRLSLFIAFYSSQQGGRAVHSPKNCLPGNGWEIREKTKVGLHVDGQPIEVNQYLIQNEGSQLTLLYWYQSRNRLITNEYLGKVLLFRDALFEGQSSSSSVRIIVPPTAEALNGATSFAAELVKSLRLCFGSDPLSAAAGRTRILDFGR